MKKVFIDGSAGPTGLRIKDRLRARTDLSLITLPEELRKDTAARREALNSADVAFLCLPDDAAIEAVSLIDNPSTAVIDTSTAHRTAPGWVYGFPELGGRRELCYDAAPGTQECTVTLPAFLLGKEKVYFRIYPSSDRLTMLPENPADDINGGTMKAGFSHPFALRLGKVSVRALKN